MNIEKNWLEWLVFLISAVLIAAVLSYLIYDSLDAEIPNPVLTVDLGEVETREGYYLVPVTVENLGDRSAEGVVVEVALVRGEQEIETAQFEVAFAPRQSTREGWVTFATDPATATLEARVIGYEEP